MRNVEIDGLLGVDFESVPEASRAFESELILRIQHLDGAIASGAIPTDRQIEDIVETCAWAHAEWVRIHPFMNGNGRTARLLTSAIALRYRLPVFLTLRPRPDGDDYARSGAEAMRGNWRASIPMMQSYLLRALSGS